jgi:hypothetical protein
MATAILRTPIYDLYVFETRHDMSIPPPLLRDPQTLGIVFAPLNIYMPCFASRASA